MTSDINWGLINDPDRFRDLCNALLGFKDSSFKGFNAPGLDRGIDGYAQNTTTIYQYKYHSDRKPNNVIKDAKDELEKIEKNLLHYRKTDSHWKQATRWVLVTNCDVNPQLETKWKTEIKPEFKDLPLEVEFFGTPKLEELLMRYQDVRAHFFGHTPRVWLTMDETQRLFSKQLDRSLMGREKEINRFLDFCTGDRRFLMMTGSGGVGKTRLMVECMKKCAEHNKDTTLYWANPITMETSNWTHHMLSNRCLMLIDDPTIPLMQSLHEQIRDGSPIKVVFTVQSHANALIGNIESLLKPPLDRIDLDPLSDDDIHKIGHNLLDPSIPDIPRLLDHIQVVSKGVPLWTVLVTQLINEQYDRDKSIGYDLTDRLTIVQRYIDSGIQSIPNTLCTPRTAWELLRWVSLYQRIDHDPELLTFLKDKLSVSETYHVVEILNAFVKTDIMQNHFASYAFKHHLIEHYIARIHLLDHDTPSYFSKFLCDAILTHRIPRVSPLLQTLDRIESSTRPNKTTGLLEPLVTQWLDALDHGRLLLADAFKLATTLHTQPRFLLAIYQKMRQDPSPSQALIRQFPRALLNGSRYANNTEREPIIEALAYLASYEYPPGATTPQSVLETLIFSDRVTGVSYDQAAHDVAKRLIQSLNTTTQHRLSCEALIAPLISINRQETRCYQNTLETQYTLETQFFYIHTDPIKLGIRCNLLTTLWSLLVGSTPLDNRIMILNTLRKDLDNLGLDANKNPGLFDLHDHYLQGLTDSLHRLRDFIGQSWTTVREHRIARQFWDGIHPNDPYKRERYRPDIQQLATDCENRFNAIPFYADFNRICLTVNDWTSLNINEKLNKRTDCATQWVDRVLTEPSTHCVDTMMQTALEFFDTDDDSLVLIANALSTHYAQPAVKEWVWRHIGSCHDNPRKAALRVLRHTLTLFRQHNQLADQTALLDQIKNSVTPDNANPILTILYEPTPRRSYHQIDFDFFTSIIDSPMTHATPINMSNMWSIWIDMWGQVRSGDWKPVKNRIECYLKGLSSHERGEAMSHLIFRLNCFNKWNPNLKLHHADIEWVFDCLGTVSFKDYGKLIRFEAELKEMTDASGFKYSIESFARFLKTQLEQDPHFYHLTDEPFDLFQFVHTVSSDPNQAVLPTVLRDLLDYLESKGYPPQCLVRLDPDGMILPAMVRSSILLATQQQDTAALKKWARFAGAYPEASTPWRPLAQPIAAVAATDCMNRETLLGYLANPTPIHHELEPVSDSNAILQTAQQHLSEEVDDALQLFYKTKIRFYNSPS